MPGKRTAKNVEELVFDFQKRTDGRIMNLMTSDEYKPYKKAILKAYGREIEPQRTGKRGRAKGSRRVPAEAQTAIVTLERFERATVFPKTGTFIMR